MQNIGGTDKKHIGEVVIDFQIMVIETGVLFGVKHFQQGGRWVSTEIGVHFVDFIEHENRIVDTGFFDTLDNFTRQGSNISSAVPSDFCLITHTAQ